MVTFTTNRHCLIYPNKHLSPLSWHILSSFNCDKHLTLIALQVVWSHLLWQPRDPFYSDSWTISLAWPSFGPFIGQIWPITPEITFYPNKHLPFYPENHMNTFILTVKLSCFTLTSTWFQYLTDTWSFLSLQSHGPFNLIVTCSLLT